MTEEEKRVAEALDRLGISYTLEHIQTNEPCTICGMPHPDFKVNDKYYHFECKFPEAFGL